MPEEHFRICIDERALIRRYLVPARPPQSRRRNFQYIYAEKHTQADLPQCYQVLEQGLFLHSLYGRVTLMLYAARAYTVPFLPFSRRLD